MSDEERVVAIWDEFARATDGPRQPPSDGTPITAWAIRGFVGAAALVLRLVLTGSPLPEYWLGLLREVCTKMLKELDNAD